jgi:hypothetical protein
VPLLLIGGATLLGQTLHDLLHPLLAFAQDRPVPGEMGGLLVGGENSSPELSLLGVTLNSISGGLGGSWGGPLGFAIGTVTALPQGGEWPGFGQDWPGFGSDWPGSDVGAEPASAATPAVVPRPEPAPPPYRPPTHPEDAPPPLVFPASSSGHGVDTPADFPQVAPPPLSFDPPARPAEDGPRGLEPLSSRTSAPAGPLGPPPPLSFDTPPPTVNPFALPDAPMTRSAVLAGENNPPNVYAQDPGIDGLDPYEPKWKPTGRPQGAPPPFDPDKPINDDLGVRIKPIDLSRDGAKLPGEDGEPVDELRAKPKGPSLDEINKMIEANADPANVERLKGIAKRAADLVKDGNGTLDDVNKRISDELARQKDRGTIPSLVSSIKEAGQKVRNFASGVGDDLYDLGKAGIDTAKDMGQAAKDLYDDPTLREEFLRITKERVSRGAERFKAGADEVGKAAKDLYDDPTLREEFGRVTKERVGRGAEKVGGEIKNAVSDVSNDPRIIGDTLGHSWDDLQNPDKVVEGFKKGVPGGERLVSAGDKKRPVTDRGWDALVGAAEWAGTADNLQGGIEMVKGAKGLGALADDAARAAQKAAQGTAEAGASAVTREAGTAAEEATTAGSRAEKAAAETKAAEKAQEAKFEGTPNANEPPPLKKTGGDLGSSFDPNANVPPGTRPPKGLRGDEVRTDKIRDIYDGDRLVLDTADPANKLSHNPLLEYYNPSPPPPGIKPIPQVEMMDCETAAIAAVHPNKTYDELYRTVARRRELGPGSFPTENVQLGGINRGPLGDAIRATGMKAEEISTVTKATGGLKKGDDLGAFLRQNPDAKVIAPVNMYSTLGKANHVVVIHDVTRDVVTGQQMVHLWDPGVGANLKVPRSKILWNPSDSYIVTPGRP